MPTVTSSRGLSDMFLEIYNIRDLIALPNNPNHVFLSFWKVFLICNLSLFSSAKAYFLDVGKMPFTESLIHLWEKKSLPSYAVCYKHHCFPWIGSCLQSSFAFLTSGSAPISLSPVMGTGTSKKRGMWDSQVLLWQTILLVAHMCTYSPAWCLTFTKLYLVIDTNLSLSHVLTASCSH